MGRAAIRASWLCGFCAIAGMVLPAARGADGPEDVLKSKGLKRQNATFVQHEEVEVSKELRDLAQLKRAMFAAKKVSTAVNKRAQSCSEMAAKVRQNRRDLNKQLAGARSTLENNQLVAKLNELTDQLEKLEEMGPNGKEAKAAEAAETKARESYIEAILKVRKLYDATAQKYEQIKADPDVKKALAQYNENADKKAELGPSTVFERADAMIKKSEETVLSEKIALRQGNDRLFYVKVMISGKHMLEIAIDTGASSVVLPEAKATEFGITISSSDEKVKVQLADGREIEAYKSSIPKLRVGKFEADNVECIIMPANLKDASPLLGQSFLRHFAYKIDTAAATLTMTRVD